MTARAGNTIAFVHGDGCQLPFADRSFDVVMAVESIFHFPSRPRFFQQAQRILRTSGTLVVSDFVPVAGTAALLKFLSRFQRNLIEPSYGQVDVFCPLWQYRRIARQSGFTLTKTQDVTNNTLPTYRFLRALNKIWSDQHEAENFAKATTLLERLTHAGILRYLIMVYQK
jgi:ubiquinone/menaquinone biosynthesis C-methylase UbiE